MYPSRISGYQDPLSWTFSKFLLTPICELVILYQPCSKFLDIHKAPHVCVIPWVSSKLVQGLLSFAHMILLVMCLDANVSLNLTLYPTMFPSTAWWNYELPFMYRYFILDIILLELVFPFFLEGSASMMSLHSSYYFSSLNYRHLFFGTSFILLWLQVIMYVIFPTSQMHLYG